MGWGSEHRTGNPEDTGEQGKDVWPAVREDRDSGEGCSPKHHRLWCGFFPEGSQSPQSLWRPQSGTVQVKSAGDLPPAGP